MPKSIVRVGDKRGGEILFQKRLNCHILVHIIVRISAIMLKENPYAGRTTLERIFFNIIYFLSFLTQHFRRKFSSDVFNYYIIKCYVYFVYYYHY